MFPDSRRFGVMWMSRDALGPAFNMEGAFNDVAFQLSPGANESEVIDGLDALLEDYGALGAYGRGDQTSHHFISNEIAELQVTSTFIPAVFLGVTAFLIHLTLSRLVATQRDQIAVLKAFGYGNLAIGLHYLKLAFAAVLGGVTLGIAAGWWFGYSITALYTEYFRFPALRYIAWRGRRVDGRGDQPCVGGRGRARGRLARGIIAARRCDAARAARPFPRRVY